MKYALLISSTPESRHALLRHGSVEIRSLLPESAVALRAGRATG